MSYLKRNINFLLLVIVILVIGFNLALMTYYQLSYESVTGKYYERSEAYTDALTELEEREQALNQTSSELTRRTVDQSALERQYSQLETQNRALSSQVNSLTNDLQKARSDFLQERQITSSQKLQIDAFQNKLSEIALELDTLQDEISDAESVLINTHGLSQADAQTVLAGIDASRRALEEST